MTASSNITQLLEQWADGDEQAMQQLTPLVYDELHTIAVRLFAREGPGKTLQPTALVNEAYERLVGVDVAWKSRAHFYALSARLMRRLLINHAKANKTAKRGGDVIKLSFDDDGPNSPGDVENQQILDLNEAVEALTNLDPRLAKLIELQYFGGLSLKEMVEVTGLSSSTIDRDLRLARAWLKNWLSNEHT